MSRRVSNPLALAVLSCLWERPMYPYQITTTLRDRNKEDSIRINFGSLYAVIKSLEKHALIAEERVERVGNRPERIVYAITEEGRAEANDWLCELLEEPAKEYPAIETGLSLIAMLPPAEATALLESRVRKLDADIAARAHSLEDPKTQKVPELFMIEFSYKLAMLKAEREIIAGYAGRLAAGTLGGQGMWARLHELLKAGHSMEDLATDFAGNLDREEASATDPHNG